MKEIFCKICPEKLKCDKVHYVAAHRNSTKYQPYFTYHIYSTKLLSCQATSFSVERKFSLLNKIMSKDRNFIDMYKFSILHLCKSKFFLELNYEYFVWLIFYYDLYHNLSRHFSCSNRYILRYISSFLGTNMVHFGIFLGTFLNRPSYWP